MIRQTNKRYSAIFRINIESITLAIMLTIIIRIFIFIPYTVSGNSMIPVLNANSNTADRIIINKIIYYFIKPKRGDIVLFNTKNLNDLNLTKTNIKRIVGLPGETITIKDFKIYINSKKLDSPDSNSIKYDFVETMGMKFAGIDSPFKIPEDTYFVLGDNSSVSRDSRYFGAVNKKDIVGKIFLTYWPIKRFGIVK